MSKMRIQYFILIISRWERASKEDCKEAIESFGADFLDTCRKYSSSVNAILKYLITGNVNFKFYDGPPRKRGREKTPDTRAEKRQCRVEMSRGSADDTQTTSPMTATERGVSELSEDVETPSVGAEGICPPDPILINF